MLQSLRQLPQFTPYKQQPSLRAAAPTCRATPAAAPPPTPPPAAAPTSLQRRAALWDQVKQSEYSSVPPLSAPMANPIKAAGIIGRMLIDPLFRTNTVFKPYADRDDVRPPREKLFHTFGSVAEATFVPESGSAFSGIFRSGAPCLVRLSLAGDDKNYVAGVAIKFFVEGKPSVNLVALPSLDGQKRVDAAGQEVTNRDFFANEPTTWFPAASGAAKLLEGALSLLSKGRGIDPRRVSLAPLAQVQANGAAVAQASAPEKLTLRNPAHHFAVDTPEDFRVELKHTYHAGDTLYEVWHEGDKLGTLRLDSEFVASEFGDRQLAFNHQK